MGRAGGSVYAASTKVGSMGYCVDWTVGLALGLLAEPGLGVGWGKGQYFFSFLLAVLSFSLCLSLYVFGFSRVWCSRRKRTQLNGTQSGEELSVNTKASSFHLVGQEHGCCDG